jgi:DNA-binding transcriptional MerR regulator
MSRWDSRDVSRRMVLVYCQLGLVSPVVEPGWGEYYFNDEAIRILRRIEYLSNVCGINLSGIKMILDLVNEAERLRAELRFLQMKRRQLDFEDRDGLPLFQRVLGQGDQQESCK